MADEGLSRRFYEKNHLGLKCPGGNSRAGDATASKLLQLNWKRPQQQHVRPFTNREIVGSGTTTDNHRPDCFSETGTTSTTSQKLSTNRSAVIPPVTTLHSEFWLFSTSNVIWRSTFPSNPLGGTPQKRLGRRADSTTRCVRDAKIITTRP